MGLPPGGVTEANALGPPIGFEGVGGVAGIDIGVTGVNGVGVDALLPVPSLKFRLGRLP